MFYNSFRFLIAAVFPVRLTDKDSERERERERERLQNVLQLCYFITLQVYVPGVP